MNSQTFAQSKILSGRIRLKWIQDKSRLPLTSDHWPLYRTIHRSYFNALGKFPNLVNSRSLNDKVQWLKLFDQSDQIIQCSDKLGVREFAKEKLGTSCLLDIYQVADTFQDINFDKLPKSFVLKTNHDSGSVVLVRDKSTLDLAALESKFSESLQRAPHGAHAGEWGYEFISRKIFAEEFMEPENPAPPPDYKFHCSSGKVGFVHFLYDRGVDTKEQTLTPEGRDLEFRLSLHYKKGNDFKRPKNWTHLIAAAEKLAENFKYVRIDLYQSQDRIYLGEMTFWPHAGLYKGDGQEKLGEFIEFDRQTVKPLYRATSQTQ